MSRPNRRNQNQRRNNVSTGSNDTSISTAPDESNPVVMSFRQYAKELDAKHDRHERIFKYSRDITIESKRIIFLLHTIDNRKSKEENLHPVLMEAQTRLTELFRTQFCHIARELAGIDPYQFARAYTGGMQEFIEAYIFCEFIRGDRLPDWQIIQDFLTYDHLIDENGQKIIAEDSTKSIQLLLQPTDYLLGLGDVGGEVMRRCINSLGSGDFETCLQTCKFLQSLYTGFLGLSKPRSKEFSNKIYTLKQSVVKTENVCFNIKVRGREAVKWTTDDSETDEGFGQY